MNGRAVIFTDEPGWHGARLRAAFGARGYASRFVSLRRCGFDLEGSPCGVLVPGFEQALPDAAFVRGVPGGTLEEIVLHLDVLHALAELGVPVYNDGRAIERTVDKCMTSFLLRRAAIPTPATWVHSDAASARARVAREVAAGHRVVLKPLFGSQGAGLARLGPGDALPEPQACQGVYYLQRFVESGVEGRAQDWRVFVIGGRAVAAMRREATGWISNVAQGGRCHPVELDERLRKLSEAAARALQMRYAGIDLLADTDGRLWVVEVNGVPAWRGLQRVCDLPLTELLIDDLLAGRGGRAAAGDPVADDSATEPQRRVSRRTSS